MLAGLSAGDRHPDWEEYALDQIEFIQYLEAMLHSHSADTHSLHKHTIQNHGTT